MLQEINISNLKIIEKSNLTFIKGLNVITGETGAGKTMVLTALNLLLGKRANSSMIHKNASHLNVEGCWELTNEKLIKEIEETGAVIEENQLFINRTIKDDGKNRSVIGGKTTPASILAKLGDKLVSIHGQSDQQNLKSTAAQRESLDKYIGESLNKQLLNYKSKYNTWKNSLKTLENVKNNSSNKKREINMIKKFMNDFDKIAPEENELEELEKTITRLSSMDEMRNGLNEAMESIAPTNDEYPSIESQMDLFTRRIEKLIKINENLEPLYEKALQASELIDTIASETETHLNQLDEGSLEDLYAAQEREIEIKQLIKKYGNSLEEIIAERAKSERELEELEEYNTPIDELEETVSDNFKEMMIEADKLTNLRKKHAKLLEKETNEELAGLSMMGNKFYVDFTTTAPTSTGVDEISFMLLAKGAKSGAPINKSASGGELSRIMLALEVVLADTENTGTFIFDEVDSGVGGETAIAIGERLAKLAKDVQVIVVTHLPQVASFADNHLKVIKTVTNDDTVTDVQQLDEDETVTEITRMLSGMTDSSTGREHARELLDRAGKIKELF